MFNESKRTTLPDMFSAPDTRAKAEGLATRYVNKHADNPDEILEMLGLKVD